MRLFVISALLVAFLAILFALQNTNLVTIQFFIWEYRQSLALILLGTLAIGVIVGLLVSFPAILRRGQKFARAQKQTDSLKELVEEKEQTMNAEVHKFGVVKQSYGELLQTLGLIEPTTGLLRSELLNQAIATQVETLKTSGETPQAQSLSVLRFKVQPSITDGYHAEDVFAAVARLLQKRATVNTWFYSDGNGLFTATTTDLDMKAVTRYGEELQTAILEDLAKNTTGQSLEADVSIGGAIADAKTSADANQLLETAEQALEQALQRGRNRLRILQVS
ncbi:MAG: lipopolysaccharide assembly protein LapA domain-containing protein [Cyanobacteria bacterium P01_F01_bin.86]